MTHPTQEDDVKALKDALALGPQAWDYDSNMRPFYNDPEGNSRGGECDGTYTLYGPDFEIDGETYEGPTLSERCKKADAKFINACNPARIARLLARLEQAERQKTSFRVLLAVTAEKNRMNTALTLACSYLTDEQVELIKAAMPDDAHIAAIASEAKT